MSILVVATPFRHRGLDIFHIFPVTKALYLLRCRVVAVAKLSNCRVPSSVIFLIFPYRAWARTLFSRSGWPPSPAGGRTESSRQPTIGQRLSMQVFFGLPHPRRIFLYIFWPQVEVPPSTLRSLQYYTMILQRPGIIVGDAEFEPGTSAPEVWRVTNEPPYLLYPRFSAFWLRSKCSICSYHPRRIEPATLNSYPFALSF